MTDVMLTTIDNPFDPFEEFPEWLSFDRNSGYHTTSLLARVAIYSDELSDADQDLAIETAIDEIIKEDAELIYRKVHRGGGSRKTDPPSASPSP